LALNTITHAGRVDGCGSSAIREIVGGGMSRPVFFFRQNIARCGESQIRRACLFSMIAFYEKAL